MRGPDVSRRQAIAGLAGGGLTLGAGRAVDNVLLGYGIVSGTNLRDQPLADYARKRFAPSPFAVELEGTTLGYEPDQIQINDADGRTHQLPIATTGVDEATRLDTDLGLDGQLTALLRDLQAIQDGEYRFSFSQTTGFFDTITGGELRPVTAAAMRGNQFATPQLEQIQAFTSEDPADPHALIGGLASGFREYSSYDIPRYLAGSLEDNILLGSHNVRSAFRSPTDFEALLAENAEGLFCYDFTYRSVEAFHAVPPVSQTVPVIGAVVADRRHKHVYTGLASVIRTNDDLVIPMTFVDYTHATLYDDLALRGLFGEGIEAYDRRHRTTDIFWNQYARW